MKMIKIYRRLSDVIGGCFDLWALFLRIGQVKAVLGTACQNPYNPTSLF